MEPYEFTRPSFEEKARKRDREGRYSWVDQPFRAFYKAFRRRNRRRGRAARWRNLRSGGTEDGTGCPNLRQARSSSAGARRTVSLGGARPIRS